MADGVRGIDFGSVGVGAASIWLPAAGCFIAGVSASGGRLAPEAMAYVVPISIGVGVACGGFVAARRAGEMWTAHGALVGAAYAALLVGWGVHRTGELSFGWTAVSAAMVVPGIAGGWVARVSEDSDREPEDWTIALAALVAAALVATLAWKPPERVVEDAPPAAARPAPVAPPPPAAVPTAAPSGPKTTTDVCREALEDIGRAASKHAARKGALPAREGRESADDVVARLAREGFLEWRTPPETAGKACPGALKLGPALRSYAGFDPPPAGKDAAAQPLAWDLTAAQHPQVGRNVLFRDGAVRFLREEELERALGAAK